MFEPHVNDTYVILIDGDHVIIISFAWNSC